MGKIRENNKNDGLLFIGFPVGHDILVWNSHRIYGYLRLELLFNKFIDIEWHGFNKNDLNSIDIPTSLSMIQPLIILKKNISM